MHDMLDILSPNIISPKRTYYSFELCDMHDMSRYPLNCERGQEEQQTPPTWSSSRALLPLLPCAATPVSVPKSQ